jgi:hypothetical protein
MPVIKKNVFRRVLALLPQHSDSSPEKGVGPSSFWMLFEKWIETEPGSPEDLVYVKKIVDSLALRCFHKEEVLQAYHIVLENDIPLRKVLLNEMEHWRHIDGIEWEYAAIDAKYHARVLRRR